MKTLIDSGKYSVWINKEIISKTEIDDMRNKKVNLTCFNYSIDITNVDAIDEALTTINEHHPDERIWVEMKL